MNNNESSQTQAPGSSAQPSVVQDSSSIFKTAFIFLVFTCSLLLLNKFPHRTVTSPKADISRTSNLKSGESEAVKEKLILMDTFVEITAYGPRNTTRMAVTEATKEMARLENIFNRLAPDSFAGQLERWKSQSPLPFTTRVPDEYLELFQNMRTLHYETGGAFNPTLAPVLDLWGFKNLSTAKVPQQEAIKEMLPFCSYKYFKVSPSEKSITIAAAKAATDCGGAGKGFIIDRAMKILKKYNLNGALVNGGGDISTFGRKPDGSPFRIGVQSPNNPKELSEIIRIHDCAVATSGDYERGFKENGRYYHHLLDPISGYPARLSRSCTVIASNTFTADAYATALFVLGPCEGIKLAEQKKGIEAMIVTTDDKEVMSSGFSRYLDK
jgi:thiamine biosynthesis lipoprotein